MCSPLPSARPEQDGFADHRGMRHPIAACRVTILFRPNTDNNYAETASVSRTARVAASTLLSDSTVSA
ncbi:hypothetical protein CLV54_2127 [Compostimonas suwonensis]|uniref:Uncharacterized protein n=1 Tax=Compostimonas suwonensis TaxID=1048394 RepID=A0A2M9BWJ3_9MICO|nr:hypothetical protein CLV54_2127 [Compostimonas suwonensis]